MEEPAAAIELVLIDPPHPRRSAPVPIKNVETNLSLPPVVLAPPEPITARLPPFVPAFGRGHGQQAAESSGVSGSDQRGQGVTDFFQVQAQGKSVVFVIDRSASMGQQGGLRAAKRQLALSLERLPDTVQFQIVAYNRRAEPLCIDGRSGLLAATLANKRAALELVEALMAEGGTEHLPALRCALALQPDVVFFLTDADDLRLDQVHAVAQLNRGRSAIHAIELTASNRARVDLPLHILARENRGEYRGVDLRE